MALIDDILDLAATPAHLLPQNAMVKARFSLLDWMTCGLSGLDEPVAQKIRAFAENEGGANQATTFGGILAPARLAALVNGTTAHALDFDDTHFAHVGHLSVGIFPAAMAMGEALDAPLRDVIAAFLLGAEAAIRIGVQLGAGHYNLGFHQTATAGAFGATVAVGRLMGLSHAQMRQALGLCSTRASGLKSQFGTMGKPLNAGLAASNGVECAQWAALGITSADDGLHGPQGFFSTHHASPDSEAPLRDGFLFEDNLYKLYACCHGTHAMIEGLLSLGVPFDQVAHIELRTNPRWLAVCDKKSPRTGLEVKFSYGWLAGMALRGDDLGDRGVYTDALCDDEALAQFARNVHVSGDNTQTDLQAAGNVLMKDGTSLPFHHDLAAPMPAEVLRAKLTAKATSLLQAQGAALWALEDQLTDLTAADFWKHAAL